MYHIKKNTSSFSIWWQPHVTKSYDIIMVQLSVNIWELRKTAAGCLERNAVPFWSYKGFLAAQQCWVCFLTFFISNVFYWVKVVNCRPVQHPDSSNMKPCCCNKCSTWLLSCWNMQGHTWKRHSLDRKPVFAFQHWWCLFRCASCQFHRHWRTPVPSEIESFEVSADKKLDGPSAL